ncbi:MAG: hypothetical protein V4724_28005 [Pseudomonadota bacterium]
MENQHLTAWQTAQIIERGILIDTSLGAASAWAFLTAHFVPGETILRVLSGPARRRAKVR